MDWRRLHPLDHSDAEDLFGMATEAVRATRGEVGREATISHVGFRSDSMEQWELLLKVVGKYGDIHKTFKPDGREIPFIKLREPLVIGTELLEYIELPAPKMSQVVEPSILVAYKISGETKAPVIQQGYDLRQQALHAKDYIERDKDK